MTLHPGDMVVLLRDVHGDPLPVISAGSIGTIASERGCTKTAKLIANDDWYLVTFYGGRSAYVPGHDLTQGPMTFYLPSREGKRT